MGTDNFPTGAGNVPTTPAYDGVAVTPSDSVDLTSYCRAIYVGTGGDVALITRGGTTLTFKNVPSGALLPIRATRIKATGTAATDIIALT